MQIGMAREIVRPVHPLPGLPPRVVPAALAVLLQRRMGRFILQSGPKLLHQSQTLQKRRHLFQHWPGILHLYLPDRVHRNRLRAGQRWLHRHSLSQRWNLLGKNNKHFPSLSIYEVLNVCLCAGRDERYLQLPGWIPRTPLRDLYTANLLRQSVPSRSHLCGHDRQGLHVPLPRRLRWRQLRSPGKKKFVFFLSVYS